MDPSVLSFASTRIFERLEGLLCEERQHRPAPGCSCTALHRHYGTNLFKCSYPSCSLSRSGFPTRSARKAHVDSHARPWKCPELSCLYATVGFSSRRGQSNHWKELHQSSQTAASGPAILAHDCFSKEDLAVLLLELIKAGDAEGLRGLAPHLEWNGWEVKPAFLLAVRMGSLPMVEILDQFNRNSSFFSSSDFVDALVKSENSALFRWALDKLCELCPPEGTDGFWHYNALAAAAFSTGSPELFAEWEDFLMDPARQLRTDRASRRVWLDQPNAEPTMFATLETLIPHYEKLSVVFHKPVFIAVGKDALLEARLIQTWRRLIDAVGPLDRRFLGWSLNMLARLTNPSITLAAELLRLGAPIDFPRGVAGTFRDKVKKDERFSKSQTKRYKGMTPLHHSLQATSEQAARFARFLLEEGADPRYGWKDVTPAEGKGVALMQQWLGESWEEVVARTAGARKARRRQEGGESEDRLDENEQYELPEPKRRRKTTKRQVRDVDTEDEEDSG
jgi:hypothetical protein